MNSMFKDTSLDVAQRQKETVLRDQRKKIEKEIRRKQFFVGRKKKLSLRDYYKKEHEIRVNSKIVDSLTVSEFEEYLKRRLREKDRKKAERVIKKHILTYVYRRRFKKILNIRVKAVKVIQRWYRESWSIISFEMKRKKLEASRTIKAHFISY